MTRSHYTLFVRLFRTESSFFDCCLDVYSRLLGAYMSFWKGRFLQLFLRDIKEVSWLA